MLYKEETFKLAPPKGQKSISGNPTVMVVVNDESQNRAMFLKSYKTFVCWYDCNTEEFHRLWGDYSVTTMKHINLFREHLELNQMSAKQWKDMECSENMQDLLINLYKE